MTENDVLHRFIFEEAGIRGEWVRLEASLRDARRYQSGPQAVQALFGEALAAAVMLAATLKFEGSLILQAQGSGAVRTLVAQASHDCKIRGLIRCQDAAADAPRALLGTGRLVITIEPDQGEPYQGIVPLQGDSLAQALRVYFRQSEQLGTRLCLIADETAAAGLLLQELPAQKGYRADWERIDLLAAALNARELLAWDCETLLGNMFPEEKIRLFAPARIEFKCGCSADKVENTLRALGRAELAEVLKERPFIEVDCEFCRRQYRYDQVAVDRLFLPPPSPTRH